MEFWTGIDALKARQPDRITDLLLDEIRNARLRVEAGPFLFDASKTAIDGPALDTLLEMAADVPARRDAMFDGARINETEDRAVLHTALRGTRPVHVDGEDVMPEVGETLARMRAFADEVRSGGFEGQGGAITDVVNIGIGGSDLGPAMATLALAPLSRRAPLPFRLQRGRGGLGGDGEGARSGHDAGDRGFQDLHHHRDADQRGRRPRPGWPSASPTRRRSSRRCPRRRTRRRPSASTPPASSASPIGWAGATRCGGRSGCR